MSVSEKTDMVRVTFTCPPELVRAMEQAKQAQGGRSISSLVREAVEKKLATVQPPAEGAAS
jgi:metal-responsive CopG/Arc/MetJ family transcriptional regulator